MANPAPQYLTFPIRSDKLTQTVRVNRVVASVKSEFQQIDVVECDAFGRMLLLDGHIQLATLDEHAYHESLVQIPMLSLTSPKRVLVVGGGDGGVLREVCRHKSIQHVDMVEIDAKVVEVCREHMPMLSAEAFDDPRVHLHIQDAFEFVKGNHEPYDLIVMDSTDVYEEEDGALSERLFTAPFYGDLKRLLSHQGLVVTQSDNVVFCPYSQVEIVRLFESVFAKVGTYFGLIPSFGGFSGFVWGSHGRGLSLEFDASAATALGLKYLSRETYTFGLSKVPFVSH